MKSKKIPKKTEFMRTIGKEMLHGNLLTKRMKTSIMNIFYSIMRKHGIKNGTRTKDGNGTVMSNYEWTICEILFLDEVKNELGYEKLIATLPKDLEVY